MRLARTLALSLVCTLPMAFAGCCAEPPPSETSAADGGTVYGEPIGDAPLVSLSELNANLAQYEGKRVRVEGMITDVCAKRGCWMVIGAEEGADSVRFKVTDGVMVFPLDAKGARAEAEGTVQRIEHDLETTRNVLAHEAEEAGEAFDPSTVTEPMVVVQIAGIGAVVRSNE